MTLIINGACKPEDNAPIVPSATQAMLQGYKYVIAPANAAADAIHAAITQTTGVQNITAGITNPDYPRLLVVVGGQAGQSGNVVITGKDAAGTTIIDTLALNETTPVNGTKAFATVTNIQVPVRNGVGDTVTVGTLNKFGLPHILPVTQSLLIHLFDGSTDAGTTACGATLAVNYYTIAGTPNGAKLLSLHYLY